MSEQASVELLASMIWRDLAREATARGDEKSYSFLRVRFKAIRADKTNDAGRTAPCSSTVGYHSAGHEAIEMLITGHAATSEHVAVAVAYSRARSSRRHPRALLKPQANLSATVKLDSRDWTELSLGMQAFARGSVRLSISSSSREKGAGWSNLVAAHPAR